jgi:hypothetical protein
MQNVIMLNVVILRVKAPMRSYQFGAKKLSTTTLSNMTMHKKK